MTATPMPAARRARTFAGTIGDVLPGRLRPVLRRYWRQLLAMIRGTAAHAWLRRWRARGDAVSCPCCERSFARFDAFRGRPNAECPNCLSLERHRLLWLFFRMHPELFGDPMRMLHFAPERWMARAFGSRPGMEHVSADKFADGVGVKADMEALPFADGTFDALMEVHVLQDVPDEPRALAELRRVLRPGAWAILHENLSSGLERTFEDPSIADSPARRREVYGLEEYVRLYGADFPDRLRAAGFDVAVHDLWESIEPPARARYGIPRERIHLCRRPS